jgi:hypothetical protein
MCRHWPRWRMSPWRRGGGRACGGVEVSLIGGRVCGVDCFIRGERRDQMHLGMSSVVGRENE